MKRLSVVRQLLTDPFRYPGPMVRWTALPGAALLAIGCASGRPPQAASSADLDGWLDAPGDRGAARSTTLPSASIPEATTGATPSKSWGTRTLAAPIAEPSRPRRRAPVDVSFHRSDMASAFQLLAEAGGFDLVMGEGLTGQVSATLRGIDPYDALRAMAEANGVEVRYDGRVVLVRKR
jgi:hypothetical protein